MPPISETEMKSYKAKSNLFYFIVYIMIFQLGSWQAHRVNLSWERFGASVPYLIYVYLYLPNGPEGSDPSWNTTLCLPRQKDYFHFPLVASRVYWWGSPDLKLFCYLLQTTVNLSTVFFQDQHETIPAPFYRNWINQFESITKACHPALPANPTVFSVCTIKDGITYRHH